MLPIQIVLIEALRLIGALASTGMLIWFVYALVHAL